MVELATRPATLIAIAREAIERKERPQAGHAWDDPWLREIGACFVTLRLDGELRGCVGTVDARRPLGDDVANNAFAAAYRDSRFAPVSREEIPRLAVEISLLSPRTRVPASSEDEALAALRPEIDGVYLEYGNLSATFLPQVWENIRDPLEFLCELRRKAGLPARFWHEDIKLTRYTVEKYR
ncbi:MAG TPA: AmmeMemoRadiSam system protein A [Usitatibacter sp.]|nr:AmmeMemoRadiSam system protein A [Usitatibacter sp.]